MDKSGVGIIDNKIQDNSVMNSVPYSFIIGKLRIEGEGDVVFSAKRLDRRNS